MGLQTVTSIGTYKSDNENISLVSYIIFLKIFIRPERNLKF